MFMYGSILMAVTFRPRVLRSRPVEDAVRRVSRYSASVSARCSNADGSADTPTVFPLARELQAFCRPSFPPTNDTLSDTADDTTTDDNVAHHLGCGLCLLLSLFVRTTWLSCASSQVFYSGLAWSIRVKRVRKGGEVEGERRWGEAGRENVARSRRFLTFPRNGYEGRWVSMSSWRRCREAAEEVL